MQLIRIVSDGCMNPVASNPQNMRFSLVLHHGSSGQFH